MATDPDLLLGRALIAAAWADGKLDEAERDALEDLLLEIDDISPDSWRALHADLQRPFDPGHRERLFAELDEALTVPPRASGPSRRSPRWSTASRPTARKHDRSMICWPISSRARPG